MSKATKARITGREVLDDYPEPTEQQAIVKVLSSKGNNLHEAEWPDGDIHLCSMPAKFRRNIWIKRGNFVIVDPIEEGNAVKGEIVHVLLKNQMRHLKQLDQWPERFNDRSAEASSAGDPGDDDKETDDDGDERDSHGGDESNSSDSESDLIPNTNRRHFEDNEYSESDSDEDD
eukprot:m.67658 g.67658  ORF g.67658 m.67658 type:complete len:174 (-) comp13842_c0_seq2:131-652(-)